METHGLLRRERRAEDERSVMITLTGNGAALRDRASAVPGFAGNAMGLDAAEFDQLRTSLRRLTGNVTKAAGTASPPAEPADQAGRR
jgi:DNA-binding MarR family transcriptional regulator